jgi:ribosomal protein S12 methylthiotransferase
MTMRSWWWSTPAASSTARYRSWKPSVALAENGKVIVTGCLGAKENQIREIHPKVLEITGPHAYEEVLGHVHKYGKPPTTPSPAWCRPRRQADPAPLRLSQDFRRLQPPLHLLHHPLHARGSGERPIGEVLAEAKRLKEAA